VASTQAACLWVYQSAEDWDAAVKSGQGSSFR
jgi:hypothetical protein